MMRGHIVRQLCEGPIVRHLCEGTYCMPVMMRGPIVRQL